MSGLSFMVSSFFIVAKIQNNIEIWIILKKKISKYGKYIQK
jgi:hypothetical protein